METQEKEKHLFNTKWHDYRMLRPDTATLVFIKDWAHAYTEFNEACGKSRHFSFMKNISDFEPEAIKKNKAAFWGTMEKLRQQADAGGYEYSDYWGWALQAANDLGFKKSFANSFLSPKIRARVKEKKIEHDRHYTKRSTLPFFKAENYRGLELQKDYQGYLLNCVRNAGRNRQEALTMLLETGEIHPDFATQRMV